MYDTVSQMEPMLVNQNDDGLGELAIDLIKMAAELQSSIHPITAKGVVECVRSMNCYYSNLIEGHNTHPLDIERALSNDYSKDSVKRALQMESKAHIETQKLIEQRLHIEPELSVTSIEFLCWIHYEFYSRLPSELRCIHNDNSNQSHNVTPGQLRNTEVQVGQHIAPKAEKLNVFLERFEQVYKINNKSSIEKVLAVATSHHRLLWIHPFLDGNGRVARLFTDAYLSRAGIDGCGMWTLSRGLARHRSEYMDSLQLADQPRQGDLDGRGNLSTKGLIKFSKFMLNCANDQIQYMRSMLSLDQMQDRIMAFSNHQANLGKLKPETGIILREIFLRGQINRGEITSIINKPERSTRRIIKQLLDNNLLKSDSPKGPLRLSFPTRALGYYFPRLYPENIEVDLT